MNIDLNLIASIVTEKDFLTAKDRGIKPEHIQGEPEMAMFKFINEFQELYRCPPSFDVIKHRFEIDLPKVEGVAYWASEISKRTLKIEMSEKFAPVSTKLRNDDPLGAYADLKEFVRQTEANFTGNISVKSIMDLKDEFLQDYEDAKQGKMGIPTPWAVMNEWTWGWQPEDMNFVMGESGLGKSWIMLLMARASVQAKVETMLISCEMSRKDMARRHYALEFKKRYAAVRKGRLTLQEEQELKRQVAEYKIDRKLFEIMDAKQGLDVVTIERAIARSSAPLVLIDSAYRIQPSKKARDRFDAMSIVADDLKQIAQRYGKSIVASTQVNRDAIKKKDGGRLGQEHMALSSVISWNSSNILALSKSDEDKNKLVIHPVKVRENENEGKPLVVSWDFSSMTFEQVGLEKQGNAAEEDDGGSW